MIYTHSILVAVRLLYNPLEIFSDETITHRQNGGITRSVMDESALPNLQKILAAANQKETSTVAGLSINNTGKIYGQNKNLTKLRLPRNGFIPKS